MLILFNNNLLADNLRTKINSKKYDTVICQSSRRVYLKTKVNDFNKSLLPLFEKLNKKEYVGGSSFDPHSISKNSEAIFVPSKEIKELSKGLNIEISENLEVLNFKIKETVYIGDTLLESANIVLGKFENADDDPNYKAKKYFQKIISSTFLNFWTNLNILIFSIDDYDGTNENLKFMLKDYIKNAESLYKNFQISIKLKLEYLKQNENSVYLDLQKLLSCSMSVYFTVVSLILNSHEVFSYGQHDLKEFTKISINIFKSIRNSVVDQERHNYYTNFLNDFLESAV